MILGRWFLLATALTGWAETSWVVHVTAEGGDFESRLFVENIGTAATSYDLEAFDSAGTPLARVSGTLEAGEILTDTVASFFPGTSGVSHLEIHHDNASLPVSISYRASNVEGSPVHLRSNADRSPRWRLFKGDWHLVYDGVAIVNTGNRTTTVSLTQRSLEGRLLGTRTISSALAPRAKALYVIGSPGGSPFEDREDSYFEIEAEQPLLLTALRGTQSTPSLLWENRALALPVRPEGDPLVVETIYGSVRGSLDGDAHVFRGIPYATPPLGELRWRPTMEPPPFEGIFEASAFGPVCPQIDRQSGLPEGDEDCLTLNIWRPASLEGPSPVMFFIHGGGNVIGSARETAGDALIYDGRFLAEETGSVVVTIQYRLGPIGYFAHPDLQAESAHHVSGNYGILDQIAALEWVRDNIAFFGGDPDRVMIYGESAGARNTCILVASPLASGLFQAALMQSGACTGTGRDAVYARGEELSRATGCDDAADPVACLRALDPADLLMALPPEVSVAGTSSAEKPHVDGYVLPEEPIEAIAAGRHNAVPFVVGANADETSRDTPETLTEAQYEAFVFALFGIVDGLRVLEEYSVSEFGSAWWAYTQLTTDLKFVCTSLDIVRTASAGQVEPVYRYFFSESVARGEGTDYGAYHALELFFVFGVLDLGFFRLDQAEADLSRAMQRYWSSLAAVGDPNTADLPPWEPYDPSRDNTLILEGEAIRQEDGVRADRCAFWQDLLGEDLEAARKRIADVDPRAF